MAEVRRPEGDSSILVPKMQDRCVRILSKGRTGSETGSV